MLMSHELCCPAQLRAEKIIFISDAGAVYVKYYTFSRVTLSEAKEMRVIEY